MSRQHAMIIYEDERFFILDTGSSNGTFVNNIRLSKTGEESKMTEIFNGDIVRFGSDIVDKVNYPITVNLQCLQNCQERKRKKIVKFQCLYYNLTDEFSRENVELILIWFFPSNIEFPIFVLKSLVTWLKGLFWLVKVKNARDFFMLWARLRPLANWFWLVKIQYYWVVYISEKFRQNFNFWKNKKLVKAQLPQFNLLIDNFDLTEFFTISWFQKFCE